MSYFLCLAVPDELSEKLRSICDPRIRLTEVTNTPIGQATCGKHRTWKAYLLLIGFCSSRLMGKYIGKKRTHNNDKSLLFVSLIHKLFAIKQCSISFLGHWMTSDYSMEEIEVIGEEIIELTDLPNAILTNKDNIRYTIISPILTTDFLPD